MNKIIIPVLASILILGTFSLTQDVYAPKKTFETEIEVEADSLSVSIALLKGLATAGEKAGFTIQTTLELSGAVTARLSPEPVPLEIDDNDRRDDDLVSTVPQTIPYVPPENCAEPCILNVKATVELRNPAGKVVQHSNTDWIFETET